MELSHAEIGDYSFWVLFRRGSALRVLTADY